MHGRFSPRRLRGSPNGHALAVTLLVVAAASMCPCDVHAQSPRRAAPPVHPLSYATNVTVSDPSLDGPSRGDTQAGPALAAWNSDILAAWNDGRGLTLDAGATLTSLVAYGYSRDGGQSFIDAGAPPPTTLGGSWIENPSIAVDERTGTFFFCAEYDPDNASGLDEHGVAFARATFSPSGLTWSTPIVIRSMLETDGRLVRPRLAADSASGNVYLTYTRLGPADSILFARSTDLGAHWEPHVTLNADSAAGRVEGSRVVAGPGGEVYVVWTERASGRPDLATLRLRQSVDGGASFGPERTVTTFFSNTGSGAPGFDREGGLALPSIAVDRSNGVRRGRVYVAWNESVAWNDALPDSNAAIVLTESGPNETAATAQPFTVGLALHGSFDSATDVDYYGFAATEGTTYLFHADEFAARYTLRVICSDGATRLAFGGDRDHTPPRPTTLVWTCPRSGTYYLRVAIVDAPPSDYRVDTAIDTAPGSRSRDHRDVFVTASADGATWDTPGLVHPSEPPGYDDWLPEIAVDPAGVVYASWYAWNDAPAATCGGRSTTAIARSDDGAASWQALGPVSDAVSDWTAARSNYIPNQGEHQALFANGQAVYACWTDARAGTPDIWAARVTPNSPLIEIVDVDADSVRVTLLWHVRGTNPGTAEVLRAVDTGPYQHRGQVVFDAAGFGLFEDASVRSGARYRYALRLTTGASVLGERSVEVPGSAGPGVDLAAAIPNPAHGALRLRFALAGTGTADLRLFDVAGRPLRWQRFEGTDAIDVDFAEGLNLRAGLYFVELRQGGARQVRRIAFLP